MKNRGQRIWQEVFNQSAAPITMKWWLLKLWDTWVPCRRAVSLPPVMRSYQAAPPCWLRLLFSPAPILHAGATGAWPGPRPDFDLSSV